MSQNNYRGFGLFNEVEDKELQSYNRGRILVNIMEDNSDKDRNVNMKGVALVAGYFQQIPQEDREGVKTQVEQQLVKKGMLHGR